MYLCVRFKCKFYKCDKSLNKFLFIYLFRGGGILKFKQHSVSKKNGFWDVLFF